MAEERVHVSPISELVGCTEYLDTICRLLHICSTLLAEKMHIPPYVHFILDKSTPDISITRINR